MRVDHLSFAAAPDGLLATAERLSELLDAPSYDGGFHARFGTRNRTLPLADGRYIEIVEVLDHPAADKAPFGQVVRARSEQGGGWLGWVIGLSSDLAVYEERLGRQAVTGARTLSDGTRLEWRQLGVKGTQADPQLPFFVQWLSEPGQHPGARGSSARLRAIELAGDAERLDEWLGGPNAEMITDVALNWVSPQGQPGISRITFDTARGEVLI